MGTLIIFIAMVLVAAVAAAVLIQTSGNLQQRAQSTGQEATAEVSSNMDIKSITGIRADNGSSDYGNFSTSLDYLNIRTGISSGANTMDLSQLVITVSDGDERNILSYPDTYVPNGTDIIANGNSTSQFSMNDLRDADNSFSKSNPVMNKGDLVELNVSTMSNETLSENKTNIDEMDISYISSGDDASDPEDSQLLFDTRTTVKISLTPEAGTTKKLEFMTPPSYGVDKRIKLYP
ncbi:archaellin/type IV pilin N-terminal domain-containing protein [Methanohalobium sp.]|uniref:archaellin/type IV pilin N-terminal domain-containing protein n=1 Tax=Methanohalobium sp. TaxID=2837493 RepID=UPI0025F36CD1|nr:archaellin/type IV pilin N-terminal domain-containing protein [Methanohalobium sp.]